jgi:pSer/pThr/pTyr-binding forkhead associated (FHA) protein
MSVQFQLVMRSGPLSGTVYPLEGELLTLGRDPGNTIHINDAEVSRRHARFSLQGGKYVLEDLGSTNGTFVNGQRLGGPHVLRPGDVISFGEQISLVFETVTFDPAATVASPRAAVPRQAAPVVPPPPPMPVAGHVPVGPAPVAPSKKTNLVPILIIAGILLLICVCAAFLWWVDATYRWCTFFGWLIPAC